ncbi:MAG: NAD-dependent epimerase/dehydratase family protein [Gemmatimonadales bacterium]
MTSSTPTPPAASALTDRRVLVTGATGFLGAHLVRALAGGGARVFAVARRRSPDVPDAIQADFADPAAVREVLATSTPDLVYHLAAHAWAPPRLDLVQPTFRSGPVTLVNLLVTLAESGRRIRVVVPGSQNQPLPGSGDTPASPYAAAKAAEGLYCDLFERVFGLPFVQLRLFPAYGPGQHPDKLIPSVALALLRGDSPVIGNPDLALDWLYVDDAVEALVAAGTSDAEAAGPIDVGTGAATELRVVAGMLADLVGGPGRPRFAATAERPLERSQAADTDAAERLLGWRARVSIREGLARTVAGLREPKA